MSYTCDRCQGGYDARSGAAVAHVFVRDSRCNHLRTECPHCGTVEVIFLGPRRLESEVRAGGLEVRVAADADPSLRRHAARAWSATGRRVGSGGPPTEAGSLPPAQPEPVATLPRYPLTERHEALLRRFAHTFDTIPDDLLWDGLESDHERRHPDRWVD